MHQPQPAPPDDAAHAAIPADDTRALTHAIARGNTRAIGVLYERHFDHAYATARRLTNRDESFCLDVVQDAMLKLAKRVPTLPSEPALLAWLNRVIHRAALDRLRADRRRLAREQAHNPKAPNLSSGNPDHLDDRIAWLRAQLRELKPADQALLAARFAQDRSLEAAGAQAGITGDAAHGRIRRALNTLRRHATQDQP